MNQEDAVSEVEDWKKIVTELQEAVKRLEARQIDPHQARADRRDQAWRDQAQEGAIGALLEQLEALRTEVKSLAQARQADAYHIQNLIQANSMQNVVEQSLEAIRVQLEPLKELTPARIPLSAAGAAKLERLRQAHERPVWDGDPSFDKGDWTSAFPRGAVK
jgi:hypothetical protein